MNYICASMGSYSARLLCDFLVFSARVLRSALLGHALSSAASLHHRPRLFSPHRSIGLVLPYCFALHMFFNVASVLHKRRKLQIA